MISNIDQIKSAANIVEIVSDHVQLKKSGSDFKGKCPFHEDKTPSFTLHGNRYKCFGCGKSGDSIDFLMEIENINYLTAIEKIAARYFIELDKKSKTVVKPVPRLEKLSQTTITYFEGRGISNNTLLRFDITESQEWMPKAQKEITTICFNYFRDGELVNIKFRGRDKDFKLSKDSELIFYNLDAIKDETTCYIVEGEIDCLSMHEAGIYNCVSVPNGAEAVKLEYLNNCWEYFKNMTQVVIMTDNDEPGKKLKEELARRIGKDRCYYIDIPPDCKDANDVLKKHGKQSLAVICESIKRWPIEGVIGMDDLYEDVVNFYEHGYPTGLECGMGEFDSLLTFTGGQFTTVTGSPQSGKSEFIDKISTSLSRKHGWKWAICSFENPPSYHVTKLVEKFIGKAFQHRKDPDHRISREQLNEGISLIDQYFYFINISQVEVTIQGILNKCRELVLRYGVKGIVIDPWNYIEHKIPHNQTETQYISESLSLIKEFAIKNDVHIFLVAHPRKLQKKPGEVQYPVATMYDISGSAHFFNKTDNGISVHRDFEQNIVTVYVQKVRFSWLGKLGFTSYTFDNLTRQYNAI